MKTADGFPLRPPVEPCFMCDDHGYYYMGFVEGGTPLMSSVTPCNATDCVVPAPAWVTEIRDQIERDGRYISPYHNVIVRPKPKDTRDGRVPQPIETDGRLFGNMTPTRGYNRLRTWILYWLFQRGRRS